MWWWSGLGGSGQSVMGWVGNGTYALSTSTKVTPSRSDPAVIPITPPSENATKNCTFGFEDDDKGSWGDDGCWA